MGRWLPQLGWPGDDGLSGGGETEATMGQGKRPDGALVSTALTLTLHSGCRPNRIRSIPTILAGRIDDGTVDVSAVDTELQTWSTQWGHGREVRCSRPLGWPLLLLPGPVRFRPGPARLGSIPHEREKRESLVVRSSKARLTLTVVT